MEYKATVLYTPDQEPYPSKFEEGTYTYNVKLQFDDPDAPPPATDGRYRMFKNSDTPEGQYIKSLRAGDRVTLIHMQLGKREFYNIRVPADTYKRDAPTRNTSPAPRPAITVTPMTDEGKESFKVILNSLLWQFEESLKGAGLTWEDLTPDQRFGTAMGLFKSSRGWWREGMVVDSGQSDRDMFLDTVTDNSPASWVKATASWFGREEAAVINAVRTMALKSEDFLDTSDGMWTLAQAADLFIDRVEAGSSESVAHSIVADEYGLKLPAQEQEELIF